MPISAPGDLPDPGISASLRHRQAGSLPLSHLGSPCQVWLVSMQCAVEDRLSPESTAGTAACDSCQLGEGWVLTGPARLCCLRLQIIVLGQHLCTLPPGRHVESQCWAQHLCTQPPGRHLESQCRAQRLRTQSSELRCRHSRVTPESLIWCEDQVQGFCTRRPVSK